MGRPLLVDPQSNDIVYDLLLMQNSTPGPLLIGYDNNYCDILTGTLYGTSAIHAQILATTSGATIVAFEDSGRPTTVNGQRIKQSSLWHGDRIKLGSYEFEFLFQ